MKTIFLQTTLMLLLCSQVSAQERNLADKSLNNPLLYLFYVTNYCEKAGLNLSDDQQELLHAQQKALDARFSIYSEQSRELRHDIDRVIKSGVRDWFLEDGRKITAVFDRSLTPEQRGRLEQIAFQYEALGDFQSPSMLQSSFVHEKLKLDNDQKRELLTLGEKGRDSIDDETRKLLKRIHQVDWPLFLNKGDSAKGLQFSSASPPPTAYIVDRKGKITHAFSYGLMNRTSVLESPSVCEEISRELSKLLKSE